MNKLRAVTIAFAAGVLALGLGGCASLKPRTNPNKGLLQTRGPSNSSVEMNQTLRVPGDGTMMVSSHGFVWPMNDGYVSSFFGSRRRDFHDGIDIAANRGTPIYAAKSGRVIYSSRRIRGYGNMIVLKHGDGTSTVYAHCQKLLAKKGTRVERGALIAKVGNTGKSTGPHLHFEIRNGNLPVDPLFYLPAVRTARQANR